MAITPSFQTYTTDSGRLFTKTSTTIAPSADIATGNLVFTAIAVDKTSGAWTTDPDFTSLYALETTAVSGSTAFRVANTSALDHPRFAWTTSRMFSATAMAFNMNSIAHGTTTQSASNGALIAANGTIAADGGLSTVAGIAIAVAHTDSAGASKNWGTQAAWSTGWTLAARHSGNINSGAGAPGISVAYKPVAVGTATDVTFTNLLGESDEHLLSVITIAGTETTSAGTAIPRLVGSLADATATAIELVAVTEYASSVRVAYGTDATLATSTLTAAVTPDAGSASKHLIAALTANTTYYYQFDVGGTRIGPIKSIRTFPTTAASFTFVYGSCWNHAENPNPTVFSRMDAKNPLFTLIHGDIHYLDVNTTDPADYRVAYDTVVTNSSDLMTLAGKTAFKHTWSDHDYCGNLSHGGSTGAATSEQVRRERFPAAPGLPTTGIYQTWVVGRVRFIMLDTRRFRSVASATDDVNKTMLGTTQKQWFKDTYAAATEPMVFIISDVPWPPGGTQDDHWGSYRTEQNELVAFMDANRGSKKKVHFLVGDAHMIAIDDGTNGFGYSTWCAAPIAQPNSTKGGPWSGGTFTTSTRQYAQVDVTDDGTTINATFTGRATGSDTASGVDKITTATTHSISATGVSVSSGSSALLLTYAATAAGSSLSTGSAAIAGITSAPIVVDGLSTSTGSASASRALNALASGASTSVGSANASRAYAAAATGLSTSTGSADMSPPGFFFAARVYVGSTPIIRAFTGTTPVKSLYVGSKQVWPIRRGALLTLTAAGARYSTGSAQAIRVVHLAGSGAALSLGTAAITSNVRLIGSGAAFSLGTAAITSNVHIAGSGTALSLGTAAIYNDGSTWLITESGDPITTESNDPITV